MEMLRCEKKLYPGNELLRLRRRTLQSKYKINFSYEYASIIRYFLNFISRRCAIIKKIRSIRGRNNGKIFRNRNSLFNLPFENNYGFLFEYVRLKFERWSNRWTVNALFRHFCALCRRGKY